MLLVADGVGGHGHGEYASKCVVDTYQKEFKEHIENLSEFLTHTAIKAAEQYWQKLMKIGNTIIVVPH